MSSPPRRILATALATALLGLGGAATPAATAATPDSAGYTVSVGSPVPYPHPTDTPAVPYVDKDGTFYFQQSAALYGADQPRYWDFFTGTDFDTASRSSTLSDAVNPANANDRNNDTTWRCNNSPTGLTASFAVGSTSYSQKNFCDLSGIWVDPDTGDWYGLVHNEFTPQPFGDGLHFDAIDYTVSTDQGRTWTVKDHVITSPFSTVRGDTTQFPNQTYHYGDGDQRLFVDTASGYFYVFYGSRIVDKSGGWKAFHEHVARAPISGKMAPSSWQKWYDGAWSQAGVGGKESNMVPVGTSSTTGYTPAAGEYDPANTGTSAQQITAGTMPATSPLFVMDITYNAYLGLYIGEPQGVDQSGNASQQYYATDNLATQKWYPIGNSGSYHTASWYRWFLDSANRTSSNIVGKNFRTYCAFGCSGGASGEYVDVSIGSSAPAPAPVDPTRAYRISGGNGRILAQVSGSSATTSVATATTSALQSWVFTGNGDGSYRITNASTGNLLGVDASSKAGRAWGAKPIVTAAGASGPAVGQQWFVVPGTSASNGSASGTYRVVNRYSGLVIGLSADTARPSETTPTRTWTNTTTSPVGGTRGAAEQTLTLTQTGPAPAIVTVNDPGTQSSKVATAVSLQIQANAGGTGTLSYSASGLPAGLTINTTTGLITGTPTTAGAYTTTVTATTGTTTGSTTFTWTVTTALDGTHTLTASGKALDNPNHSTVPGTQLITYTPGTGANQKWIFAQQTDGTYRITNAESGLCMDVNGGSTTAGTAVIQWPCTTGANQRWTVTPATGGGYKVTSKSSGLLLTTASTTNGALVTQQPDTGTALQRWTVN
ncbi:RICIN domain-containing protein [Kitasatospora purpeofusca]|uniref:RICIN domain-containing protein n=1 Tax=Kitasatospora purpeofusca TaxID=67352 RepID=UPI002258CB0B|nr:RICIN domain-containing protein [Kitasatospora purpeofusca]MCX4755394.1 RICIN domain-containing protein [Kitasatospora purpeofusca]WSR36732.1 RICIN domain-containing protein [Kitasatospora purpeofusca]